MTARPEAGGARRGLVSKEDAVVALHPFAGCAVQPPVDSQRAIAAIADMPAKNQPAQILIINGTVPDHAETLSARRGQVARRRLAPDQRLFAGHAPGIAADLSALPDHPVAGDQHGDRIGGESSNAI